MHCRLSSPTTEKPAFGQRSLGVGANTTGLVRVAREPKSTILRIYLSYCSPISQQIGVPSYSSCSPSCSRIDGEKSLRTLTSIPNPSFLPSPHVNATSIITSLISPFSQDTWN